MTSTNTQVLFRGQIKDAAPNGIDVYFENVVGKTCAGVLGLLNKNARITRCGLISQYSNTDDMSWDRGAENGQQPQRKN